MATYIFKAIENTGNTVEGTRDADDEQSVVSQLQAEGYIPISVSLESSQPFNWLRFGKKGAGLSQKEVMLFTKELATLLEAGLPLDRALVVLKSSIEEDSGIHKMIDQVLEKIKGGSTMADALQQQNSSFSRFYINMLRAGEAGGNIEDILGRLSNYLESSKELKDTVTTAMIYPTILVVMSVGSVFLLLTYVVPQFTEMFESSGKELPLSTQFVVAAGGWLQSYWWIFLLAGIAGYSYLKNQFADKDKRKKWDKYFLGIPLAGDIIANMTVAAFSRTLGTLLNNGVPILTALSIAKETVSNTAFIELLEVAEHDLKEGKNMSGALLENGRFPVMAVQMIKIGEETGKLDQMLERVANVYDKQLKNTVERLLALMEPLIIVSLGLIIAGIIISILSAILSVNDLAF